LNAFYDTLIVIVETPTSVDATRHQGQIAHVVEPMVAFQHMAAVRQCQSSLFWQRSIGKLGSVARILGGVDFVHVGTFGETMCRGS
jgi:hypothetical protein